jgi:WD40 repeat protein
MIDFFVSYAREDMVFAQALVKRLTDGGWSAWIDEKDIPPSVPWMTEIQRAIDESMMVIVIESNHWLTSSACLIELELAEQGRVPIVRVLPGIAQVDERTQEVVQARLFLPQWRAVSLAAAELAAIWKATGRKKSLLSRGRALREMQRNLIDHPGDFSPSATKFVQASGRAATRRLATGLILGLIVPLLAVCIGISVKVAQDTNAELARTVANTTAAAQRSTYSAWNVYAGLERAPTNISNDFFAYRELFINLTDRTPTNWDATPVTRQGPLTAVSPDGESVAAADGAVIVVTGSSGNVTRLLAGSKVTALAWSPNSRWIAASTVNGADVISAMNGQIIPLRGGLGTMISVSWDGPADVSVGGSTGSGTWHVFDGSQIASLDGVRYGKALGDTLYTVNSTGILTATDTLTGTVDAIPTTAVAGASPTAMETIKDVVAIAFVASESFLRLVNPGDGSFRDIPIPACLPLGLSLAPDGGTAYVACSGGPTNKTRVDLTTGRVMSQPFEQQESWGVRVLRDRVLWGGIFGGVFQTGLDLSSQGMLTSAAGCGAATRQFIGLPDGSTVFPIGDATGSNACATRIEIKDGAKAHRLIFRAADGHAAPDAAICADGSLIAYGMSDGQVRVFTTDQLVPVYFGQVLPDQVRSIAFSADGKSLIVAGLSGEVTSVALPYLTAASAENSLVADGTRRLQNAISWGIYAPTTDARERK